MPSVSICPSVLSPRRSTPTPYPIFRRIIHLVPIWIEVLEPGTVKRRYCHCIIFCLNTFICLAFESQFIIIILHVPGFLVKVSNTVTSAIQFIFAFRLTSKTVQAVRCRGLRYPAEQHALKSAGLSAAVTRRPGRRRLNVPGINQIAPLVGIFIQNMVSVRSGHNSELQFRSQQDTNCHNASRRVNFALYVNISVSSSMKDIMDLHTHIPK